MVNVTMDELKGLVGREIGVSEFQEITQERISLFGEATDDRQWIHIDAPRAGRESPYGGTIAHGFLTLALIGEFTRQVLNVTDARLRVNYGLDRVRFPSAVRSGSRVRGRVVVDSADGIPGGRQVKFLVTVELEGASKPACFAEFLVRYLL